MALSMQDLFTFIGTTVKTKTAAVATALTAEVQTRVDQDAATLTAGKLYSDTQLNVLGGQTVVFRDDPDNADFLDWGTGVVVPGSGTIIVTPPPTGGGDHTYAGTWQRLGIGGSGSVQSINQVIDPVTGKRVITIRTDSAFIAEYDETDPANKYFRNQYTITSLNGEPGDTGGANAYVCAPGFPNIRYMYAQNDVWRSTDGGAHFNRLGLHVESFPNDGFRSRNPRIAVDPRNPYHFLVGTQYDGIKLFIGNDIPVPVTGLAGAPFPIDPNSGLRYWNAGTNPVPGIPGVSQGGYGRVNAPDHRVTTDKSLPTETNVQDACPGVTAILFDPVSPVDSDGNTSRIFAFIEGGGMVKSEDAGRSWAVVPTPWKLAPKCLDWHPNGDLYMTSATAAWSITRWVPTTGGTYTLTLTDKNGATYTTSALSHHAQDTEIRDAMNALGIGSFAINNFVDQGKSGQPETGTWKTSNTVDCLIQLNYKADISLAPFTLTINATAVTPTQSDGTSALTMREDTVATNDVIQILKWRPSTGAWALLGPTKAQTWNGIKCSPLTPGFVVVASQGGFLNALDRFAFSPDSGGTWGQINPNPTADIAGSDVPWMAGYIAQNGGTGCGRMIWDLTDPLTFYGSEGIGVWKFKISDPTAANQTFTQTAMSKGIEQLVTTGITALPAKPGKDTTLIVSGWDRGFYVMDKRGVDPSAYYPSWEFSATWSIASIPGVDGFAAGMRVDDHDGVLWQDPDNSGNAAYWAAGGAGATLVPANNTINYNAGTGEFRKGDGVNTFFNLPVTRPIFKSGFTMDKGVTWKRLVDLPKTASGGTRYASYLWGEGSIVPTSFTDETHWSALLSTYGSAGVYRTTDGSQTWTPVVIPSVNLGKIDISSFNQHACRRPIAALGNHKAIMAIKGVGIFYTKDDGANWVKRSAWTQIGNIMSPNTTQVPGDDGSAQIIAVNNVTGKPGGGGTGDETTDTFDLYWITGNWTSLSTLKTAKSTDGGVSWQLVSGIGTSHALAFTPTFDASPGYLMMHVGLKEAGGYSTSFSPDKGATWLDVGWPSGRVSDRIAEAQNGIGDPYVPGRFYFGTKSGFDQIDVTVTS